MELDALKVDVCKVFSTTEICFSEIFASNIFAFHFSYMFLPVTVHKDISHKIKVCTIILELFTALGSQNMNSRFSRCELFERL